MSNVSEHSNSEFYFPKKKKKEKSGGHMIKCLLTELGQARRENIWTSVMVHEPRCARSVRHDLRPNIFLSGPPTQSISTYYFTIKKLLSPDRPAPTINLLLPVIFIESKNVHPFTSQQQHIIMKTHMIRLYSRCFLLGSDFIQFYQEALDFHMKLVQSSN